MNLKPLAAAAALAVGTLPAFAATTDFGTHDPVEFGFGSSIGAGSTISDFFTFTLGSTSTLTTTAVSNESSTLDLSGASVFLYKGAVGSGSFVSGFSFDAASITSSITPLAAGAYYYLVSGTVGSWANAGSYALTSQVAPVASVPEPGSVLLMLAGLGAMGFIAARRSPPR